MNELIRLYQIIRLIQHFGGTPLILHVGREGIGKTAGAFTFSKIFYPQNFSFIYNPKDLGSSKRKGTVVLEDVLTRDYDSYKNGRDYLNTCGRFGILPQIITPEIAGMVLNHQTPYFKFHYIKRGKVEIHYPALNYPLIGTFTTELIWEFSEPEGDEWEKHQKEELERIKGMI